MSKPSLQDEMEFESLFADAEVAAKTAPQRPQRGDEVTGRIVRVGDKFAEVELEGGFDALYDLGSVETPPKPHDRFAGHVVRVRDRVLEVSTGMVRGSVDLSALYDALATHRPVEGKVLEVNKGGLVVEIGATQGFCPLGQMDIRRIEDPSIFVGQRLVFQVMEMREGRQPVLSRRRVLEAEAAARAVETRARIALGVRFRGTITSVRDYGVFVDIGGLEGLIPRGELGYGRKHPSEIVQPGQTVEVEVINYEPEGRDGRDRITLSLRAMTEAPFEAAAAELPERAIVRGRVVRVQPYGAFVELADGVEGLLHVSAFGRRVATPRDMVSDGDQILVRVRSIDQGLRRISLAWVEPADLPSITDPDGAVVGNSLGIEVVAIALDVGDNDDAGEAGATHTHAPKSEAPAVNSIVRAVVDRHLRFGLLVALDGGHEGFVPYAELEVASQQEARRKYSTGTTLDLLVFEAREDGRIRLSLSRAEETRERATARAWLDAQQPAKVASAAEVGTFGEMLKQKLGL